MARRSNLGLEGNDPVEYSNTSRLVPGDPKFKTTQRDTTYCFVSRDNAEHFVSNPARYCPQLEGNCAFTFGMFGKALPVSYQYSNVVGGRIYLYAKPWYRILSPFIPGLLSRAHANFTRVFRR